MGLAIQPTRRLGGKIATLIAVFALVMQPMYGLVAENIAHALGGDMVHVTKTGSDSEDCGNETAPCLSIQYAIDKSASGDTIKVGAGEYHTSLSINKSLQIIGAGQGTSSIVSPVTFGNDGDLISISGAGTDVEIASLTISGASDSYQHRKAAVHAFNGASLNIHDVTMSNIRTTSTTGKYIYSILIGDDRLASSRATATIDRVNISEYQRGGIYISGAGSFATITNNTVTAPTVDPGTTLTNGILVQYGANAEIRGNTVIGNIYSAGSYSASGIVVWDNATTTTTITDNSLSGNDIGIGVSTDSPAILSNVNIAGNTDLSIAYPISPYNYYSPWSAPSKVYVNSSWPETPEITKNGVRMISYDSGSLALGYNAFSSLQDALNSVAPGGTVELLSEITTTDQTTIGKPVAFNGNGYTIHNSRNNSDKDTGNNSVIGIQSNDVTISDLVVDGTGGFWMHGVNVYESENVQLDNVKLNNNSNAGLIVGRDSDVTVNNISTSGNGWYGINVDRKESSFSRLHIMGQSSHNEGDKPDIYTESRDNLADRSVQISENPGQYARWWLGNGYTYKLDTKAPEVKITVDPFNPNSFNVVATDDRKLTRIDYSIWKDNNSAQIGVWGENIANLPSFEKDQTTYCDRSGGSCEFKPLSGLEDGEYTLRATVKDVLNKSTDATDAKFIVDRKNPTIRATLSDDVISSVDPNPTISLELDGGLSGIGYSQYKIMDLSENTLKGWINVADGDTVDVSSLGEGSYILRARTFDGAGNKKSGADVPFSIDRTAPAVTITSDGQPFTNTRSPRLEGTVDSTAQAVEVSMDGQTWSNASYTPGQTTWSYQLLNLPNGRYAILARATDQYGNVGDSAADYTQAEFTIAVTDGPVSVVTGPGTQDTGEGRGGSNRPAISQSPFSGLGDFGFFPQGNAVIDGGAPANNEDDDTLGAIDVRGEDGDVLSAEDNREQWSLINLLLTIIIAALSIIALAGLGAKNKDGKRTASRLLTLVPALGAGAVLLFVENFSAAMGWVNIWTLLIVALVVVQMILLANTKVDAE